jgi:predicted DNA binding CopG/RHH family protein
MQKPETTIPKFKSESEEADWWFNNQDYVLELFKKAAAEGRLGRGTAKKRFAERQAAISTTIRLDPTDLSRAKQQAERKGLRYQTYLKMLIHEALGREETTASKSK